MDKIIIADSSILICFAKAKKLDLLKNLTKKIIIPNAVYKEIVIKGRPGAEEVSKADWIKTEAVKNKRNVNKLPLRLGIGEREAIILTKELNGFLLIDDPLGRAEAEELKIKFTGTLGILEEARAKNLISEIKLILDELMSFGLRLHPRLYKEFLGKIGE